LRVYDLDKANFQDFEIFKDKGRFGKIKPERSRLSPSSATFDHWIEVMN
jgi:hypothetical protein